ncbi:hypothetical protein ACIRUY_16760 [Streptomyces erythrochromogenes]|uniref:hypothetical protein n=1 Tax=Streptomyces erythrochromogenes TaxID=285574 RepID=UPI003803F25D
MRTTKTSRWGRSLGALAAAVGLAAALPAGTAHANPGDQIIWTNGTNDVQFRAGECVADAHFGYTTANPHPNQMYANITKTKGPGYCRIGVRLEYRNASNQFVSTEFAWHAQQAFVAALGTRCVVWFSIQRPGGTSGWYDVPLYNPHGTCTGGS